MLWKNWKIIFARFWVGTTAWSLYLLWEKILLQLVSLLFCIMVVISLAPFPQVQSFLPGSVFALFEEVIKWKLNHHTTVWSHILLDLLILWLYVFSSVSHLSFSSSVRLLNHTKVIFVLQVAFNLAAAVVVLPASLALRFTLDLCSFLPYLLWHFLKADQLIVSTYRVLLQWWMQPTS